MKKIGLVLIIIVLLVTVGIAFGPPTDPDGEVVFMPEGPSSVDVVTFGTGITPAPKQVAP